MLLRALMLLLATGSASADAFLFENVNVITMEDATALPGRFVLVRDGRIDSIGESAPTPEAGITVIDGSGHYLMPGLAEMHAHIPNTANRQEAEDVLFLYLSQGLTTVRGMLGEPGHLTLRAQSIAGQIDAPRIYAAGPSLNGNSVGSPEQAEAMVRDQQAKGYDHIKLHPGLTTAEFDAIAATARELSMPFVGHVSESFGASYAIDAGMTGIDHLDGFVTALVPGKIDEPAGFFGVNHADDAESARIPQLVDRIVAAGTWVVPTETLMESLLGPATADELLAGPGMQYVSPDTKEQWRQAKAQFAGVDRDLAARFLELRLSLIDALAQAGANLALGSDAPQVFNVPGFSAHRELALYVEAGLTPFQALQTGTVNVARYLGKKDRGKLLPGYEADLVLLTADPLADIANSSRIAGVMVDGRWYGADRIRSKLEGIEARIQ